LQPQGLPDRALHAAAENGAIALSLIVFAEIAEVLARPKFAPFLTLQRRKLILHQINDAAIWIEPAEVVQDCRDGKDNKYLELALAAHATAIITGDKDLLVLHPWRGIHILSPSSFLNAAH
jgi:putative PIN family toxin of toxin-antitoxin system